MRVYARSKVYKYLSSTVNAGFFLFITLSYRGTAFQSVQQSGALQNAAFCADGNGLLRKRGCHAGGRQPFGAKGEPAALCMLPLSFSHSGATA